MSCMFRASVFCLLPLAVPAFRTAVNGDSALEQVEEIDAAFEFEAELDAKLEAVLTHDLGDFEATEADVEDEGFGSCRKARQPLIVGGHKKTYSLPKTSNGKDVELECMEPYIGNIVLSCKGRSWAVKEMNCRKDPNAASGGASPSPAPMLSATPSDLKKNKCYALCKPVGQTPKCGRCTHKQQCENGLFCCPFLKLCLLKGGTKDKCGDYSRVAANCQGCGKSATSPEDLACKCSHGDWPKKWLGKCTNSPEQWKGMCADAIDSELMKR